MASLLLKETTNKKHVSLLSWNILAQCYFNPSKALPFQLSYGHVGTKSPLMNWEYRKKKILNNILQSNKDIICLQEVEFVAYEKDLLPFFSQHGFTGSMQTIKNKNHPQGVATFWRPSIFLKVSEFSRNRTLTTVLKDQQNRLLAVVNCHLEGNPSKSGERTKQLCSTLLYLNKHFEHHAVIISGDFNCQNGASTSSAYLSLGHVPILNASDNVTANHDDDKPPPNGIVLEKLPEETNNLPVHILSAKGNYCLVNDNQWIHAKNIHVPFLEWNAPIDVRKLAKIVPHPYIQSQFKSVYPPVNYNMLSQNIYSLGEEFTFCTRPGHAIDGLDQMWYTNSSLHLEKTRTLYSDEERAKILSEGLPNEINPSDHIAIGATFSWSKNTLKDLRDNNFNENNNKGGNSNGNDTSENDMAAADLLKLASELYNNIPLGNEEKEIFSNIVVQLIGKSSKGKRLTKEEIEANKKLSLQKKNILSKATPECKKMLNRYIYLHKKAEKKKSKLSSTCKKNKK